MILNRQDFAVYHDRRIASIFSLGIISGTPWVMIGSALTLWLQEAGVSRSSIGFAGLIFSVYALNFFWAPLLDRFAPSMLLKTRRTGHKQSWVVLCQIVIALCCFLMSAYAPENHAKTLILWALLLAVASATQDMAIDAYRIQSFLPGEKGKISAGAAAATGGWWTGYAALGFAPLALSDQGWSWPSLYQGMGLWALFCAGLCLLLPTAKGAVNNDEINPTASTPLLPQVTSTYDRGALTLKLLAPWGFAIWAIGGWGISQHIAQAWFYVPASMLLVALLFIFGFWSLSQKTLAPLPLQSSLSDKLLANLYETLLRPLQQFFTRNGLALSAALLAFIFLFKVGEAFLGRMSIVFYKELGFSKTQIAFYSKTLTWGVTLLSAIPAGLLNVKLGVVKSLMISGLLMALSNILFSIMATVGPVEWLYGVTIVVDGFTAAWATVAFVAFISRLCDYQFSATQYALLASLGNLGRTTLASNSGLLVDWLDGRWAIFFILTTLMIIPSLLLLWRLAPKLNERLGYE